MARRLGIVVVCVVSLVGCVGLAWWQWERFESATGSWQNLGYVLQWPLFGLFPAFMFWRLRKLRATVPAPRRAEREREPEPWRSAPRPAVQDDHDPELAEYNRYLARLNETAQDQQESR
jgi:DNA-binding transcriptional regulator of glucitol operon